MSKQKKIKPAPEESQPQPKIKPPGVIRPGGHGPHSPVDQPFGVEKLRRTLQLSDNVPLDRLCEDAAAEIENLRSKKPQEFQPRPKLSEVV